ncbi:MAG: acetyl-CoA carboxylase biotin carboxyl carrier protein subunit [Gammaproteobacteria bacterium]|nr:acetyl-CoA carboxylase biotin carboxyl carrier protein subunit [Gammaproteobacteria bacterium]
MALVEVESEVTGKIWKVQAEVGNAVAEGEVLVIVESMKMEIPVESPVSGTLKELLVTKDDKVDEDQVIALIEE